MRGTKRVVCDTKRAEERMHLATTENNKTAVQVAYDALYRVVSLEYRGRHDTWTAARDRAARKMGLPLSYAKRLWQRSDEMKDVSGEALLVITREAEARKLHAQRQEEAALRFEVARQKFAP